MMMGREQLYNELRELYSKEEAKGDSISKGLAIEKIVNSLIGDISNPFRQMLNVTVGKREFDGEFPIGRGKTILYEIQVGTLSNFRYDRILEIVKNTFFPRKTYFLIIAYSFPEGDRHRIKELVQRVATKKIQVCFIDYETLISLHRFSSRIEGNGSRNVKTVKRLFFERLFENNPIVSDASFEGALSFAEDQYPFEMQRAESRSYGPPQTVVLEATFAGEERIKRLEEMAMALLNEIRALREESRIRESEKKEHPS